MSDQSPGNGLGGVSPTPFISHIVVNVSNLNRSVAFYEATTTLRCQRRFAAPAQSLEPLGVDSGATEIAVMTDAAVDGGPALHLAEVKGYQPGSPSADGFTGVGLFRMCFQSAEVEKIYADVLAAGGEPFTAPLGPDGEHQAGRPVFSFPDPDGTVIEYVTRPGPTRLYHVNCNCSDLSRSSAFYEQRLGLLPYSRFGTTKPTVNSFSASGPAATFEAQLFSDSPDELADGRPRFIFDLVEWTTPKPVGRPHRSQLSLGIVRVGVVPTDFAKAYELLGGREVAGSVGTFDYGPAVGSRQYFVMRDPDGAVIELLDRPVWTQVDHE